MDVTGNRKCFPDHVNKYFSHKVRQHFTFQKRAMNEVFSKSVLAKLYSEQVLISTVSCGDGTLMKGYRTFVGTINYY